MLEAFCHVYISDEYLQIVIYSSLINDYRILASSSPPITYWHYQNPSIVFSRPTQTFSHFFGLRFVGQLYPHLSVSLHLLPLFISITTIASDKINAYF